MKKLLALAMLFSSFFALTAAGGQVVAVHGSGILCANGAIISDGSDCSSVNSEALPQSIVDQCHAAGASLTSPGEQAGARGFCIQQAQANPTPAQQPDDPCNPANTSFFGITPWYKYLDGAQGSDGVCNVTINNLNDIWKIALAVLEALTRVAGYVAVGFIIYSGFRYSSSQGQPEKTAQAMGSLRLAVIGLIVSVSATIIVSFIAGRF